MKRQVKTHSQHFLRSPRFIAELVGHSNIRPRDTVIDIGAGSGAITSVLARRSKQVIAYEIEPYALNKLRQNMQKYDNVEVVAGDFLRADLPATPYKVFSNIPFHLSAKIVCKLTMAEEAAMPRAIYLIVQKQFAQKIIMSDRHFTALLGAQISPWWQARIRRPLKRTDFTPPPAVDTVLLELKPRETPLLTSQDRTGFNNFVERCYLNQNFFTKLPRAASGVNPERKPSELSSADWVRLYQDCKK